MPEEVSAQLKMNKAYTKTNLNKALVEAGIMFEYICNMGKEKEINPEYPYSSLLWTYKKIKEERKKELRESQKTRKLLALLPCYNLKNLA